VTVFSERPKPSLARDGNVLPEGWADLFLDDMVVHAIGGEWGEADEAPGLVKVSVIRGTEFRSWARDRGATAAERWIRRSRVGRRLLQEGDIVVEISGGGPGQPVGRTLRIDGEALRRAKNPLVCANFCRLMRLHPAVDPAFVQLALHEKYLRGEIADYQTQTTNLRNLNFDDFRAGTVIRLAPLAEQKRIVSRVEELLDAVQGVRDRLTRTRAFVKRLRQAVLAAAAAGRLTEDWRHQKIAPFAPGLERAFAVRREEWAAEVAAAEAVKRRPPKRPARLDPGAWLAPDPLPLPEVPEGWSLVALQDVLHGIQYGTSVRAVKNLKNGVPVLRMGNIQDGAIDLSDLKMIDRQAENIPAFRLQRGDILFNRTNSPELVGKAAVFDHDLEAVFASYLVRIRCDESLVSSRYVCAWINSPWGRQWARAVRTDCVSQSNINASKLLTMPLPAPPLAEQEEIVRRMEALCNLADVVEKRVEAAWAQVEKLPRTILERAMRGELVPTEADLARYEGREHEPAALLVAKILADREEERRPRLEALPRQMGPRLPGPRPAGGLAGSLGDPGDAPPGSPEEILAAFRRACWGAKPMTSMELLRKVEIGLEGSIRPHRGRLEELLEIAVERRILLSAGGLFLGATPKFARYDDDFLLGVIAGLLGSLENGGLESDPRTLTRAVAVHLGYSQVTAAMRDRMEEVFAEGLRSGRLAVRGGRIYVP
jgi:type I restriction enzyme S subunit